MTDQTKFTIQCIISAIGAFTAILPQAFPLGMPSWAQVTTLACGAVVSVLTAVKAGQTLKNIRMVDVDGDGDDDIVIEVESKKE